MAVEDDATEFRLLAEELIAESATAAVLRKATLGGVEYQPTEASVSLTDVEVVQVAQSRKDQANSLIKDDMRKLLLSTKAGAVPAIKDKIAINATAAAVDGDTKFFEILRVDPLSLGSQDLLYTVWIDN